MKASMWLLLVTGLLWFNLSESQTLISGEIVPSVVDEKADQEKSASARLPKNEQLAKRSTAGLQALYDFQSASGEIVKDRSGVGRPVDLRIRSLNAVRRTKGSLEVRKPTIIRSEKPASKIIQAVRKTGEVSIEAWVQPAKANQSGPARIVTISRGSTERNITLGQDGKKYDIRLWTTETSPNGLPSVTSPQNAFDTKLTHVVYTRDRTGRTRIYLNGDQVLEEAVQGSTLNWHGSFSIALANEFSNNRPWLGTYHLVAIYNRDLLAHEVEQHYLAGPRVDAAVNDQATVAANPNAQLFNQGVAPLLAKHCLECHGPSSKKGKLDLARNSAALAGGENGPAIVPGELDESLLWVYVDSDEMPKDRPPLSNEEKSILKRWIEGGATWSTENIDPSTYAYGSGDTGIWLRRLTVPEYVATVKNSLGVDISDVADDILPKDLRADGFSNTSYNLSVDLKHVEAYARLAEIIVDRLDVKAFARRFSKSQKLTDKDMRGLISKMGKWLLRGPLEDHEITVFRGISTTVASAGGNFEEAVSFIIEAMLQSPRFIYRIENQRGDGTAWPVGDYELASRLSYIIWGSPPDEQLMRAADNGELYDRNGVKQQIQRMLKDARAVERSAQFVYEWLNLARLDNLRPNPDRFPNWDDQLANDMRDETLAFFKEIAWEQNRPLTDLLNAQLTFASPRLADHYGLKSKTRNAKGTDLKQIDLSSVPARGGLLTQGSVLTVGGDEASMVTRGLFVLKDILRGAVSDPPPCVDTTPIPTKPGLTQRGIAEQRIADSQCGGCHSKFEPLAFGLEKFDGIGVYHEQDDHGNGLRDDGEILFPGDAEPVAYESSAELMDRLAGSDRVRQCMTWKVTQFAIGRPLTPADASILESIDKAAQDGGGTYASLITAIVLSELVQMTPTEPIE